MGTRLQSPASENYAASEIATRQAVDNQPGRRRPYHRHQPARPASPVPSASTLEDL